MNNIEQALTHAIDQKSDVVATLLQEMRSHLNTFFDAFDPEAVRAVIEHLVQSKGALFLTGVGKSGIIAKKIAATLSSSGTKALFLPPLDALHGDVGVVSKGDTVLFLSKSGETDELIQLCLTMRSRGVFMIAVVSNAESRLGKMCDMKVMLPVARELCPFDLVPTTSTLVQLVFGDLLAISLMHVKRFSIDDFAQNHPAGRLGKRLTMRVSDVMITGAGVPYCSPTHMLMNVLPEYSSKRCGALIVVDEAYHLKGIFTDGDLRRSLEKYGAKVLHMHLHELMTNTPRSIAAHALAFDALKFMEANPASLITVLPVLEEGKVVGILKMHDLVQLGL